MKYRGLKAVNVSKFLFPATAFMGNIILAAFSLAIPLYAYSLGATQFEIGLVGASIAFIYSFAPFFMGGLSDRIGQVKIIISSFILIGLISLSYLLVSKPLVLVFLRGIEGVAWAIFWPAIEAGTASLSRDLEEGLRSYNVSWSIGATIGPLLTGFTITYLGAPGIFYVSSTLTFLSCLFIFFFMRSSEFKGGKVGGVSFRSTLSVLKDSSFLYLPLTSSFFYSFITSIVLTFFPPYAVHIGFPVLEVGFLAFLYGVSRTVSFLFARKIQKRFGSVLIIELFTILLCFTPVLIYLRYDKILYYLSFLLMGTFVGLIYSCSLFTVMNKAGERVGLYAGLFESAIGFGYMVGPLFGGFTSSFNLSAPYILCGFIGLALALTQGIIKLVKK